MYHVITLIPRLNLKRQHKNSAPTNLPLLFFLTPRSKDRNQSLRKAEEISSLLALTLYTYIQKKCFGRKSPDKHIPPLPTFPPPHNFLSFLSLLPKGQGTGCEREWGWREGGRWGERRKRAAIKAILAAYVSLSLTFFHPSLRGWVGED